MVVARSLVIKCGAIPIENDAISIPRCRIDKSKDLPLAAELEMDLLHLLGLASGGGGWTVGHVCGNNTEIRVQV